MPDVPSAPAQAHTFVIQTDAPNPVVTLGSLGELKCQVLAHVVTTGRGAKLDTGGWRCLGVLLVRADLDERGRLVCGMKRDELVSVTGVSVSSVVRGTGDLVRLGVLDKLREGRDNTLFVFSLPGTRVTGDAPGAPNTARQEGHQWRASRATSGAPEGSTDGGRAAGDTPAGRYYRSFMHA